MKADSVSGSPPKEGVVNGKLPAESDSHSSSSSSDSEDNGDVPENAGLTHSGLVGTSMSDIRKAHSGSQSTEKRHRVIKSVGVYATFFANALVVGSIGPAMVSLQTLLDTSLKMLSLVFSVLALACLPGTILMGIFYDNVNKNLLFALANVFMGLSGAVAPFTGHILGFLACYCVFGLAVGVINTAALIFVVQLWDDHKWKNAHMHLPHLMISAGATIGPFLLQPFLPESLDSESEPDMNATIFNYTEFSNVTSLPATESPPISAEDAAMVRYAFVLLASSCIIPVSLFGFAFLSDLRITRKWRKAAHDVIGSSEIPTGGDRKQGKKKKKKKEETVVTENKTYRAVVLVFVFFIFYCWLWMEFTTPYFLAPFAIRGLGWSNRQAALVTSVFWGCQGAVRAAGVPLSVHVPAKFMVLGNVTLALTAVVILMFSEMHDAIVWLGAGLLGLSVGTFFGSSMVLTSEHITLTQTVSSTIMLAFSVSQMTAPFTVGYMMEAMGHMTLIYSALAGTGMAAVFLVFAKIYVTFKGKGQLVDGQDPLETDVPEEESKPLDGDVTEEESKPLDDASHV